MDLGGLDGDESYEPRPLLHVPLGECQAPEDETTGIYRPNGCHGGGNNHVSDSSFEASSAPMRRPIAVLKQAGSDYILFIVRQVRPEKTDGTRTRDTGRNQTKMQPVFTSRSFTFNHCTFKIPHKVRQHVIKLVPIAYISHL